MSPSEFTIRLQRGITGGFTPVSPSAIYSISKEPDSEVTVASLVKEAGRSLPEIPTEKTISSTQTNDLVNELETILKAIPTESPQYSEDIYGLDTGIIWRSDDFEWSNKAPEGCGGGPGASKVQATDGQREKFKRAVEIIEEILKLE
ncbi:hypothetical protein KAF25_002050 [Fusarium avenaceum]|uniref:Uncharacterized protein n=1 Tax=Fusarium avenaceum TaxID=40199 RepID=A0A9P7KUJ3_9HYPO|nr:hypothetical protein KAF25_002050 [Fusarium avenaceum]